MSQEARLLVPHRTGDSDDPPSQAEAIDRLLRDFDRLEARIDSLQVELRLQSWKRAKGRSRHDDR